MFGASPECGTRLVLLQSTENLSTALSGMSYADREAIADMDHGMDAAAEFAGEPMSSEGFIFLGDEGFEISHAGGEHEVYAGLAEEVENVHGM
jgi:hypothetical protein